MDQRRRLASALLVIGFAVAPPVRAAPCSVAQLDWLKGTWRTETADGRTEEERWTDAPGGVLLGSAWTVTKGKAVFGEIMTIESGEDGPAMRLRHFSDNLNRDWEGHDPPMLFRLADCQTRTAVLEGRGKNEGERLTYRRADRHRLVIIGDFLHAGKPDHEEWTMQLARDRPVHPSSKPGR
jgi:hypothetical protein